jgi:hypothetical protein
MGTSATPATRPSGQHPYGVLIHPVSDRSAALSPIKPAVCLFITDPGAEPGVRDDRLRAISA